MNINDRELLARTLQAEAGNQGYDGMLAAGSVIMNRANATGYGDGIRGVILKPGQFSAWNSRKGPDGNPIYADGEQGQDMANMRASDKAYKAADNLISGTYEDATGGATHYYNPEYSQPKWGQKAGEEWKRIGDHVFGFADAGKKPNPNQAIASDTMRALGKQPNGLLGSAQAPNNTESKMIPEEKPRGLLGSLGIQKMVEGAEGEDGQRFFQRDSFGDAMAGLAPLLGRMGVMGLDVPTQAMADRRFKKRDAEQKASKTLEALARMNTPQSKAALEYLTAGGDPVAALKMAFSKPTDGRTAGIKEYERAVADGFEGDFLEYKTALNKAGAAVTNFPGQPGAESELRKKMMTKTGETFSSYLDSGAASSAAMVDLNILQELSQLAPSGPLQGRFAEAFPEFDDVASLRESIRKRVAPTLRVEGSGQTSDLEFNAMLDSLGNLKNTPEANSAIISVMQEKAKYNTDRAAIISAYQTEEAGASLRETREKLAALDSQSRIPAAVQNIIDRYSVGAGRGEFPNAPPIGAVLDDMTFKGGDPGDRNNWEAN